jgi:MOSC domain-containing protein YiiM
MFNGTLEAIYIAARKHDEPHRVEEIEAVPGRGLVGDRYCVQQGTFSKPGSPDREVTLIEIEAIEALRRENTEIMLEPGRARRNLVTRDVPLNHLVGKGFLVGDVLLHGIRLCEPCGHLESLTQNGVKEGLCHRGGLRAQILRGGSIRVGAPIRPAGKESTAL